VFLDQLVLYFKKIKQTTEQVHQAKDSVRPSIVGLASPDLGISRAMPMTVVGFVGHFIDIAPILLHTGRSFQVAAPLGRDDRWAAIAEAELESANPSRVQLLMPLEMEIHPSLATAATPQSQRPSASSGPLGSPAAGALFEPGLARSPLEGSAAPPVLHPLEVEAGLVRV